MKSRNRPASKPVLAIASTALILSACGGGGDDASSPVVNDAFGPGSPSTCPKAVVSDVWINNRLGCLTVGQPFMNAGATATGAKADRAYLVGQQASDQNFNSLLAGTSSRYFKFYLCIRNAPENLTGQQAASSLADALGIGSVLRTLYLPTGVTATSLHVGGGRETPIVAMACSSSQHPVVVDFNTGKVESVNTSALTGLQVYDF